MKKVGVIAHAGKTIGDPDTGRLKTLTDLEAQGMPRVAAFIREAFAGASSQP